MSKATTANNAEALFNYAVDALSAASNWTFDIEENGIPLKDAKDSMLRWAADAPDALKSRLQAMATVRTKKGFAELTVSLEEHTEKLRSEWQDVLAEARKEAEAAEAEAEQGGALNRLDSLAEQIDRLLAERAANTLALGKALTDAKALFDKGADFIAWAEKACNLKRAQVFKWIKVYSAFGGEPLFNGVAMRVLYTLTGYAEDSEVFQEACKVLDAGETLDSKRLTAIIQEVEEANKPAPAPEPEPVTEPELVETEGAGALDDETAPWNVAEAQEDAQELTEEEERHLFGLDRNDAPEAAEEPEQAPSAPTVNPPVQASELTRRDRMIEELQQQIKELTEALARAQATQEAATPQLPPLPQFDQACPFAVLGLSRDAEGDAAAIKKAHRALAKLYSGQPEVSEKLMNARKALLNK